MGVEWPRAWVLANGQANPSTRRNRGAHASTEPGDRGRAENESTAVILSHNVELPASAVVLCGGLSTRMGRTKAALPFGGETLLERVLRLVAPCVDDVVLAAGAGQRVPAGWDVVRDASDGLGPVPALLGALSHVRHAATFVVACDTPLLQPAIIARLVELSEGWDACVPVVGGVEMTTCAVYRADAVLAAVRDAGEPPPTSLRKLIAQLRVRSVDADALRAVDPDLLSFSPCNTPDEYRRALELAGLTG